MPRVLPFIPWAVFAIIEPVLLIAGFLSAHLQTASFVFDQYPYPPIPAAATALPPPLPSHPAQVLALFLGNVFLLLALLQFSIFNLTAESRIAKAFVVCLGIGDIGHISSAVSVLGWEKVLDIQSWNGMLWGNVGISVILHLVRWGYLLGAFGNESGSAVGKSKSQ